MSKSSQELRAKTEEAKSNAISRVVRKYDLAYTVSYLTSEYILQADFDLDGLWFNARWSGHGYYPNPGEMACVWGRIVLDAGAMDEGRTELSQPLPWEA